MEGSTNTSQYTSQSEPLTTSILLVDDHPSNLIALEAILEPLGQRLVRASSGREALRHLLREDFAVILLDVQMPDLSGFETARLVRQRQRSRYTPIIFLTAHSREESDLVHGYEHGAVDYVVKPFNPDVLRWKVEVFVSLFLQQQRLQRQEAALWELERRMLARQSEQRFRSLVDALPLFVWAMLPDGAITYTNRCWLEYAGLTPEQGRSWNAVDATLHPEDLPRAQAAWEHSHKTGQPSVVEYRIRRNRDGTYRWFMGRMLPELEEGMLTGWIVTATDIDDSRRAIEALQAANEAKDIFLTMAAHELRTPLQAARGFVYLARLKGSSGMGEGVERALQGLTRSVDRMARLVENLLDMSKLQRGELSLEKGKVDLRELLTEVAEHLQPFEGSWRIEVRVPEGLVLTGDRQRLEQVFTNLISNALRYSPDGGLITVEARKEGALFHVWVRDRGLGIPPDKLRLVFERFSQAHGTSYGGLGLGLSIARGIVERHGGRIWAESTGQAGEGSTFHVVLPPEPRPPSNEEPRWNRQPSEERGEAVPVSP
ncbi:response regulator EpsF [Hyalangium minutum]|uniref:histidine kinase n=1 Tax=Hyalangium minutum TaxID=394096 RepID=A0A085W4A3_9BACT|nr:response regulator EpsF [Hyalangium minutum]KFE62516.1 Two-component hybrid sensor and regulator [Hyalangium minutum]